MRKFLFIISILLLVSSCSNVEYDVYKSKDIPYKDVSIKIPKGLTFVKECCMVGVVYITDREVNDVRKDFNYSLKEYKKVNGEYYNEQQDFYIEVIHIESISEKYQGLFYPYTNFKEEDFKTIVSFTYYRK